MSTMIKSSAALAPSDFPARLQLSSHDPVEGISAGGKIVTGASRSRIPTAFHAAIASAIELVSASGTHTSLYVYGSVATGMARAGSSDIDFVTIGLSPAVAARTAQALSAAYAQLCRSVDIGAAQLSDYEGPSDEAYGNRVFLRHYCVHLAGPDVGCGLPEFAADRAAARGFNGDIGLCADRWRAEAQQVPVPSALGRRVARKTLLAVAGLVSIHDNTWTTDRLAAAWKWGIFRPQLAGPLGELVAWSGVGVDVRANANAAGPSPSQIQHALDGVVAQVVDAFGQDIGFWRW